MAPMRTLIEELGDVERVDESQVPAVVLTHFRTALKKNKPSVSPDDLTQYVEWTKLYGTLNNATGSQMSQDDDDDDDWL
jgi:SpoVK/Ycf46/Vps4 family AAA+-type ATPase